MSCLSLLPQEYSYKLFRYCPAGGNENSWNLNKFTIIHSWHMSCFFHLFNVSIFEVIRFDTSPDTAPRTRMIFNLQKRRQEGFVRAVTDPYANLVHVGLLRGKYLSQEKPERQTRICRRKCLKKVRLV